ncbi:substrate-binding domain-containing protein [uncultured Desulfuromusa sp.]|uniref:substrate-binding domain-containing protein n=1 Tax=uncultured Desulfuromusa sp. TaxID=219183 RepID=UPI002AA7E9C3|nr:substrate-binding domain-containing protein [uncultured Desulfuromusa sp.]
MKQKLILLLLFIFQAIAVNATAQDQLLIEGTGDNQQLLRVLARAFEAETPGSKIIIPDSIGSSGGVRALVKGKCDMARLARLLKEKETTMADDLVSREFALSPVLFVANLTDSCVDSLSYEQITDIFSGKINNWSQLGKCQSHEIYLAMREVGDSSRNVLEQNIPGLSEIREPVGKVIYSTPETRQIIEEYPFTFSFLPKTAISSKMTVFALNGIVANEKNIQKNEYPLVSPYSLVWRGEPSGLGQKFLDFVFSAKGAEIIRTMGAVPVSGN